MPYKSSNYHGKTNLPASAEEMKVKAEDAEMKDVTNTGEKEVPTWLSKIKEGGVKKIPKDVLKRRRNYRLKKMLTPKPPMMVLFELVPHTEIVFNPYISDPVSRFLKITANYDGKVFEGVGPSKSIAKNICSEQILQHIAFRSCVKEAEQENSKGPHEEETPWTALASVALFKLFNDWQAQGVVIPPEMLKVSLPGGRNQPQEGMPMGVEQMDFMEGVTVVKKEKKEKEKKAKGPKVLPENPTQRHPVQLLNEMEGQLEYETTVDGLPPNTFYTITVSVNGIPYTGSGKNKKEAKKIAAQSALAAIHNVHYPPC
ncbi:double-stranded RNA-specific editase 1 isoform X3 [Eurytemora carolleeae]|uniref:double-stranded RNA-specific editase 1 isoform X3 n=1 Tax=Eurytemora carolleeae TaxID=1294199 RepID=UPI000C7681BD|nr:double-stranded RNA-specific editase 1 isoform X3 [Eurytemora carolleeae]|eukprot:XP_023328897.1 double-stranded RNA-specific editase 1-like isoform X3 [Eurytemora affinis]